MNKLDRIKRRAEETSFKSIREDMIVPLDKEDYEYLLRLISVSSGYFATKDVVVMGDINRIVNSIWCYMRKEERDNLLCSKTRSDNELYKKVLKNVSNSLHELDFNRDMRLQCLKIKEMIDTVLESEE